MLLFFFLSLSVVLNHAAGGPQHCLFGRCLILKTTDFYVEATIAEFGVSDNEHVQCWAPPEPQMKTTALAK